MDMTITPAVVKQFEADQQAFGTTTAIYNIFWLKAAEDLGQIGVRRVSTIATRETPVRMRGRLPLNAFPKLRAPRR